MSARIFLFVSKLLCDSSAYLRCQRECSPENRRSELRKQPLKLQAALSLRGTCFGQAHAPEAQNPQKPRGRLPAGSPIAEMVAQEQKTNSPNFSIITEELDACQLRVLSVPAK